MSDTIIYRADLNTGLTSLRRSGQTPSTSLLQTLLTPPSGSAPSGSQPRSINFAQFLTLFGQKLLELDTEQEILDAFACFDEDDDGLIDVPRSKSRVMGQEEEVDRVGEPAGLRGWLKEYGDRMTDKEASPIAVICHWTLFIDPLQPYPLLDRSSSRRPIFGQARAIRLCQICQSPQGERC